jgi:hypothetical protein
LPARTTPAKNSTLFRLRFSGYSRARGSRRGLHKLARSRNDAPEECRNSKNHEVPQSDHPPPILVEMGDPPVEHQGDRQLENQDYQIKKPPFRKAPDQPTLQRRETRKGDHLPRDPRPRKDLDFIHNYRRERRVKMHSIGRRPSKLYLITSAQSGDDGALMTAPEEPRVLRVHWEQRPRTHPPHGLLQLSPAHVARGVELMIA